ncbi:hypothetical protein FEM48_Zijuj03G0104500 [Ziziphus jujuba var. spinosa]|uniref:Uncharacterized protein n=1 Tax=Ziziphus jujuba var. spinosa TaxID=714518 RepID=A0A978VPS1_ZIZJJ|nr:hypothetical protein FEM48_Zijuj03G0104500 [Ziziphus jujuba var. spinosa]
MQNRSTTTSTHKRENKADYNNTKDVLLASFQHMFDKFIDQLKVIADILVKGHEDRSEISNELKDMGLSVEDHLDVFGVIVQKPHCLTMFRSTHGLVREMFVRRLLSQLREGSSSLND